MSQTKAMPQQIWQTELTANDSTAKELQGVIRWEYDDTYGLRAYRYIQNTSTANAAIANGTACSFADAYKMTASGDISDAAINQAAGVGIGAITNDYYGWIQCYGYHSAIKTDAGDDIADGDYLILHASTDGVVDRTAGGTAAVSVPIGVAVAADSDANDTVAGQINCL
jgi:hypothetical protein